MSDKEVKTLFILPNEDRDGIYYIMTDQGEVLANHWCSGRIYAKGDLESRRPERQKEWHERFGNYEVKFLDQQEEITQEELLKRNKEWFESLPDEEKS